MDSTKFGKNSKLAPLTMEQLLSELRSFGYYPGEWEEEECYLNSEEALLLLNSYLETEQKKFDEANSRWYELNKMYQELLARYLKEVEELRSELAMAQRKIAHTEMLKDILGENEKEK